MNNLFDGISVSQLRELRAILTTGATARAEVEDNKADPVVEPAPGKSEEAIRLEVKEEMDEKERIESLEAANKALTDEKETLSSEKAELVEKASQVDTLTKELSDERDELETLRKFKTDSEEAAARAERLKTIKSKLDEAEVESDVEADADYWLSMTEETLTKTIAKFSELKKGAQASASINVPPVNADEGDDDTVKSVSEALKARKAGRISEVN